MSSKKWGEAHRREALRRTYEIAAELSSQFPIDADEMCMSAGMYAESAEKFRTNLKGYGDIDATRIDREVRRVRALAEGRLVREMVWNYRREDAEPEGEIGQMKAHMIKDQSGGKVIRITRIRRAT